MAQIGDLITWSKVFAAANGTPTDPTVVRLYLREEIDGTELEWSYTTLGAVTVSPAAMNNIVRDSAGTFHLDFIARKPERITVTWVGTGVIFQTSVLTQFVRHSLNQTLDPPT